MFIKTQTVTVEGIGEFAFYDNELVEINLPSTLTTIGDYAFFGCSKLENISLPQSLESIGLSSFSRCSSLRKLEIPGSVSQIKGSFYRDCSNLELITFPLDSPFEWIDKSVVNKNDSILIAGNDSGLIPDNVKAIGDYAFNGGSFSEIIIPKKIQTLGKNAYANCGNLSIVRIEDSNQPIFVNSDSFFTCPLNEVYVGRNLEYNAWETSNSSPFVNNSNLKKVTLGGFVTRIPINLFMMCSNLVKCEILGNIEYVGPYAFYKCESLQEFPFTDLNCTIDCIELGTFVSCKGFKKIVFPQTIVSIKGSSFEACGNIDYVYINPALTVLDAGSVFDECSIDTLVIGDSNTPFILSIINSYVSAINLGRKTAIRADPPDLQNISYIRYGDVYEIAENLNNSKYLKTIDLGVNVNQIDYKTFSYCSGLTSIISRNPIPPKYAIFPDEIYLNAEVKVPKGSLVAYQADENWRNFWNISEMDFSDVDNVINDSQSVVDVYDLQGVRVRKGVQHGEATQGLPQGIYIINGEKVLVK